MRACFGFTFVLIALTTIGTAGAAELHLEEGFVRLDNGRDLTGWYASKWSGQPTGDASGWSVVDGAIQLDAGVAKSNLFSKKPYSRNCVIRLQFRAAKGADSGLCLHGKQFQIRDYPNSLPDTMKYAPFTKSPGQWNELEVDVTDGVAVIRLNGTVIEKAWPIGDAADRGLGLQKEKGDFAFRFIRVKEKKTPAADAACPAKPNIVFIIVDDLGPAELSCLGHEIHQTPNIDRMAAQGMRFTRAYSGCCVCAPARSTLMTGFHTGHTTVRGNSGGIPIRAEDVTVAEVLQQAGYACGGFGKWGIGDAGTPGVPEKNGFDVFFGYYDQVHAHFYFPRYLWRSGLKVELPGNARPVVDSRDRKAYQEDKMYVGSQFSHHVIFDEAVKFIRENKDRPFFCYCPWTPPHGLWPLPPNEPAMEAFKDKPWPEEAKVFAGMVKMIDRNVGEIMALLKELGLDEETIVLFCSDNGGLNSFDGLFRSTGPLKGYKGQLYEGGIRVPLIARWPKKIEPGSLSDQLCYFPDVMPTLAELAGACDHVPKGIDGISIVPTLLGAKAAGRRQEQREYLYWEQPGRRGAQAIRMGKWKAVWPGLGREDRPAVELYDLSTDVGEADNVADDFPETANKARTLMTEAHTEPLPQLEPPTPEGRAYR